MLKKVPHMPWHYQNNYGFTKMKDLRFVLDVSMSPSISMYPVGIFIF